MADRGRPFARVYYRDLKQDYPQVYFDPTALAAYVRLLVEAEVAYPSDPILPKAVRRADLELLTNCGLVIRLNGHEQYQVKGYRVEREQRSEHAKKGADGRWE